MTDAYSDRNLDQAVDPLEAAETARLGVVSRRWGLHVLVMLAPGPLRFSDLCRGIPEASRRILTERLREFGEAGLIERTVEPGPPITSTYRLTDSGERFRHIWTDLREFARDDTALSAAS